MNGLRSVSATEVCPCRSGKTWGRCCGELLEKKDGLARYFPPKPGEASADYFVISIPFKGLYTDDDGRVPVFYSKKQAAYVGSKIPGMVVMVVVGIAQTKFADFEREVDGYYFVPESEVVA